MILTVPTHWCPIACGDSGYPPGRHFGYHAQRGYPPRMDHKGHDIEKGHWGRHHVGYHWVATLNMYPLLSLLMSIHHRDRYRSQGLPNVFSLHIVTYLKRYKVHTNLSCISLLLLMTYCLRPRPSGRFVRSFQHGRLGQLARRSMHP